MAVWPSGIASSDQLYSAVNNVSSTLNGAINNSTTTVVLTDASAFPASGFVTIGTEAISYTSKTGNSLNGVVRGADGTTAASHLDGSGASHYVVAAHHNALKNEIIAVEQQLSDEMAAIKEPTGFPSASTTTISVVDGTRTFTIAPTGASFDVYVAGKKYTKTSESVVFTDTEGVWYFYYNASGVLTASQTIWDLALAAPVALLYWNATSDVSLDLADERHGCAMDWATHKYLHLTVGTRYVNGLAASGYVLNSAVNADVRFAFASGAISDEDLHIDIAAQTEPAQIPVFYRSGAGGNWKRATATDYPYLTTGSGRIAYNLDTAGTWSQAEVSNTDFCAYWIFATNGKNYPIIAIQGQRQDTSLANAQNNNLYESLAFGTLPYAEMKLLFRVLVQTSNAYGSTMKVRVVEVQDLRVTSNLPSGSYVATDHNSLSGRTTANSHPASAISNTPAGTVAATDVQAAIDELDSDKAAAGAVTSSGLTMTTARLLGRSTASTGAIEEITVGSGLTLSGGSLTASGGGSGTVNAPGAAERIPIYRSTSATLDGSLDAAHYVTYNGNIFHVINTSAGEASIIEVSGKDLTEVIISSVGGTAGVTYQVVGTTFVEGCDTTDSSKFKIGLNDFNTDDLLELTKTGLLNLVKTGSAAAPVLTVGDDADTGIWAPAANTWAVATAGTERLRVGSSGNVGIGVTPSYNLHVKGGNAGQFCIDNDNSQYVQALFQVNGASNSGADLLFNKTTPKFSIRTLAVAPIVFATSASAGSPSDAMTIDTAGNVGIGVAPTAKLTIGGSDNPKMNFLRSTGSERAYLDYTEGTSTFRIDSDGDITLNPGNAAAIRLDSAGKVGIGGTPGYTLDVVGPPNDDILNIRATGAGTLGIRMSPTGSSSNSAKIIASLNGTDTDLTFRTGGADRLIVKANGRVGINRSPVNYRLEVAEGDANTGITQYPFALVGTTTGTAEAGMGVAQVFACEASDGSIYDVGYLEFNQSAVSAGSQSVDVVIKARKAGSFTTFMTLVGATGYLRVPGVYGQTSGSSANVYVDSSGNVMRSTSSLRYKTDILDVTQEEAERLLTATPVSYSSLCESDKGERHYGLIAEELHLIDPLLVSYEPTAEGEKVPIGVQYERVVVGLLKLVQDLTKRVADLEAKADKPCTDQPTTIVDNTTPAADSTSSSL